eukprot:scaffold143_cov154-Amphora_coffeaeformis.AAC.4
MRVTRLALAASLAIAISSVPLATAFAPPSVVMVKARTTTTTTTARFATSDSQTDDESSTSICDIPENSTPLRRLQDEPGGGTVLRNLELTAADGSSVTLGTKMGDDNTSVVVFLRHLA